MTHPLYTPSTARSPKVISFDLVPEEARDALYAKRDQLIEEQLRAKFQYGRLGSGEVA